VKGGSICLNVAAYLPADEINILKRTFVTKKDRPTNLGVVQIELLVKGGSICLNVVPYVGTDEINILKRTFVTKKERPSDLGSVQKESTLNSRRMEADVSADIRVGEVEGPVKS
jgi:hypothetical protein